MKVGRVAGVFVGVLFVAVTVRALYLHRVWTIARIWAKLPASAAPHPVAFFLPDAWGVTAHGVYADIVFLKVRSTPGHTATILATCAAHDVTPSAPKSKPCDTADWYRVDPALVSPKNLAACYGVADRSGIPGRGDGKGFRLNANVGGWVSADESGNLSLAVYRTR